MKMMQKKLFKKEYHNIDKLKSESEYNNGNQ